MFGCLNSPQSWMGHGERAMSLLVGASSLTLRSATEMVVSLSLVQNWKVY